MDFPYGGLGNDTYYVDALDVVTEYAGEGTDTIYASAAFDLSVSGNNVENIYLLGLSAFNLTGNELANQLTGNAANNSLVGGGGNDVLIGNGGVDTLVGGLGDDTYYVDSSTDVVTELANQGYDTVYSSINSTMDDTRLDSQKTITWRRRCG